MGVDYNQFTKAELVSFLNKYGDDFKYIAKPYQVILEEKINKKHDEIDRLNSDNRLLIDKLKNATEDKIIAISKEIDENNRKWNKLNLELDKLTEQLWGRR